MRRVLPCLPQALFPIAWLLTCACGKKPTPLPELPAKSAAPLVRSATPTLASASTPSGGVAAPPAATASSSLAELNRPEPPEYEPSLSEEASALFERELRAARKAFAQEQYEAAIQHYTQALSTGRNDARCLGERGYAHWLSKHSDEAISDLWLAAGARGSDRVLAQVWYNLGLAFEEKQPEFARAAFARSLALGSSRQARSKLGTRSACQTSIRRASALGAVSDGQVVTGWQGVHQSLGLEGEPGSEARARAIVCSTQSKFGFLVSPPEPNCTDAPPWNLSCCSGLGGFMVQYMTVIPRPQNRFFTISHGSRGSWPRECKSSSMPELSIHGAVLVLKTVESSIEPNMDFHAKLLPAESENVDLPCRVGPSETKIDLYQLDTGQQLAELRSLTPSAPHFSVSEDGREATVRGPDCDAKFALH